MSRRSLFASCRLSIAAAAVGAAGILLSACGWFEDPRPDIARASLTAEGEGPVRVILSTVFVATTSEFGPTSVELLDADTLEVTLPWERTVDIRQDQRFFIQVTAADSVGENTRMKVFLDDELRYDQERDVLEDRLQFLYQINRPLLTDVNVL